MKVRKILRIESNMWTEFQSKMSDIIQKGRLSIAIENKDTQTSEIRLEFEAEWSTVNKWVTKSDWTKWNQ